MTVRLTPDTNYTDIPIDKREFIFTVDWLRDYFNCNDKYPNTGDFIRRVVDGAIKSINKKTMMRVSYRTVKQGRSISHIVFKIDSSWSDPEIRAQIFKLRGWEDKPPEWMEK